MVERKVFVNKKPVKLRCFTGFLVFILRGPKITNT